MHEPVLLLLLFFGIYSMTPILAGISPVHNLRDKEFSKISPERYLLSSPHKVLQHLDNSILKATKNVTQNKEMEENLFQISKDLVSAILSKLETQDKITRITREALEAPGKNKGITAIETRRILDYISRTLSGHILGITRASTEPELHRLVYGLAQISAEVSIVSALKDITYASALSKRQSVDLSLRKKRSLPDVKKTSYKTTHHANSTISKAVTKKSPTVFDVILNRTSVATTTKRPPKVGIPVPPSPYSVMPRDNRDHLQVFHNTISDAKPVMKGFLNETALQEENKKINESNAENILMETPVNSTNYVVSNPRTIETEDLNAPVLSDDLDARDNIYRSAVSSDIAAEMELDQPLFEDEQANEKRAKMKLEKLEIKAKKAIIYAGDVAYLTAASVVAMRRALTASIEVQMSVKYAKNGMSNHQDLMMNLAKTAAQQAGKEARSAASKSLACERVIKLALKYTAQSHGATLNHVANRIVMDSLPYATLAKSMAFVSSDIAINSLYQATDVKQPSGN